MTTVNESILIFLVITNYQLITQLMINCRAHMKPPVWVDTMIIMMIIMK